MPDRPIKSVSDDAIALRIVVATGRRGEIGLKGGLLFRLKADMAHFRATTAGKPVLMGRKTWEGLQKRPLPGRSNVVVSRNANFLAPGATVWSDLSTAIAGARAMAARQGVDSVSVIGGAEIYAACLPYVTRISLTDVDAETEADAFFPAFDRGEWIETSARRVEADADNVAAFTIRELVRR